MLLKLLLCMNMKIMDLTLQSKKLNYLYIKQKNEKIK
jgi:hypothetical protein